MPEASGVALGLDRLVMLATGASHIDQVQWTPVAGVEEESMNDMSLHQATRRCAPSPISPVPAWSPEGKRDALEAVAARYAVAVTPAMADLIDPDDPADPIARQFVPDTAELTTTPDERADPIGDGAHEVGEGLIHRYPDRVLLKLVSVCPVYCRFCFRRETVGQGGSGMLPQDAHRRGAWLHPRPRGNLGGDPLRRRSADRRAAPPEGADADAGGSRPCEDRPLPQPRAGGGAGARHR